MTGNPWVVWPLACLAGGAFIIYLLARFVTSRNEILALATMAIFAVALLASLPLSATTSAAWHLRQDLPAWGHFGPGGASLRADPGALVILGLALGLGAVVAFYSGRYLSLDRRYKTYYPLLLLLVAGLVGMVLAADLFTLYLFCELMSIASYVLVAFRRRTDTAIEAGFKYLSMGSVGTILILLGISLVYRETGSLALQQALKEPGVWARAGLACFLAGLSVKSAIVPLHTWLPDAHGRAPSSISALLSGIVIQSAFYALLKIGLGLGFPAAELGLVLIPISFLNMTVGNVMALRQTHTKRLLAYSTVAQMGYIMFSIGIGLRFAIPEAIEAGFFLLLAHTVMKGLAFLCKGTCYFYCHTTTIDQLRGLSVQLPLTTVTFSVALAGLVGIPPLAGFTGKWLILTRALSIPQGLVYLGVAVFLLNTLVSLGYYLPLITALYAPATPEDGRPGTGRIRISPWMAVPLLALGGLTLAIGFAPGPWLAWVADVGDYLLWLGR